jgi:CBS domain-containing protein
MKINQENKKPVHEWPLADIPEKSEWIDNYKTVEQFMAVDLFTVRPEDVLDLAASLMHWRHVRHVPVEDDAGNLIGIVSHRDLIEILASGRFAMNAPIIVRDIMKTDLVTVVPETPTLDALELMRVRNIGCLPVVKDGRLIGIVTAHDFLTVSSKLFEERLSTVVNRKAAKQEE